MKRILINFFLGFWILLPLVALLWLSISQLRSYPDVLTNFTTWNWKILLLSGNSLLSGLILSFCLAFSLALVSSSIGLLFSFYLRNSLAQSVLAAFLPYTLPTVLFGILLQYFAIKIGLGGTIFGVAIIQLFFLIPYSFLLFTSFWRREILAILFTAETLGACTTQLQKEILWPLIKPWYILVFFQCAIISWFEYGITRWVGIGKVQTLPILIMQFIGEGNPYIGAVACLLLILPVVFIFLSNKNILLRTI